jgi:hypothetical protein
MSITYEDALATLQSMFGEPWTRDSLDAVLRHQKGHMENTVDLILRHGNRDPDILIDQIESGVDPMRNATAADEELARQLAQQGAPRVGATRPTGSNAGPSLSGKGKPTTLPDDFLRSPGATPINSISDDEALARMLQDELFTEELRRNPDFAHLARGRVSDARIPTRTISSSSANAATVNPMAAAANRLGELTRSLTGGQQQQQHPQRSGSNNAVPQSPNILDKISELGDNAKRRLQLLAAQFNANHNINNNNRTASGEVNTARAPEFRSLLDHDDDNMELAARKDL